MCWMIFHKSQPERLNCQRRNCPGPLSVGPGLGQVGAPGLWWQWEPVHRQRCCSIPREAVLIGASPDRMSSMWWRCSSSWSCLENMVRTPLHLWFWASAFGLPAVATCLTWLCSRTQTKLVTCISWVRTQRERCHSCALPKSEMWVWVKQGTSMGLSLSMRRVAILFAPLALSSCP